MIELSNVTKTYGINRALDNASLSIPDNGIYGLVGPNGAGKSTLLKILTLFLKPDSGVVLYDGNPADKSLYNKIGYLPEQRGLYNNIDIETQLIYFSSLKGIPYKQAKDSIDFWLKRFDAYQWKGKKITELSKGMQQVIQFIACVIHNPRYVFMDEPFSGIDPIHFNMFVEELSYFQRQTNSIIVMSTHNMKSVERLCQNIAFINKSEIVYEGPLEKLKIDSISNDSYLISIDCSVTEIKHICSILDTNGISYREIESMPYPSFRIVFPKNEYSNKDNFVYITFLFHNYRIVSCSKEIPAIDDLYIKLINS